MRARREDVLTSSPADSLPLEALVRLATLDDLWADYVAAVSELRAGTAWISLGYGDPLRHYLREVHAMFGQMEASIEDEVAVRLAAAEADGIDVRQRGATWTYLSTDEPFGQVTARILQHIAAFLRDKIGLA